MPQKCIFCAHLIDDETWTPHTTRCTHACPTEAMATYLVEPEEMQKIIEAEDLQEYLPEHGTKPHTLYKNLHRYTKNFITAGVLVNGDCFEGATVTLHSAEGGIVCNLFGAGVADCHDSSTLATRSTNFFGEFKFDGLDDGEYRLEVDADGRKHTAVRHHRRRVAEPGVHRTVSRGPAAQRGAAREGPSGPPSPHSAGRRPSPGASRNTPLSSVT